MNRTSSEFIGHSTKAGLLGLAIKIDEGEVVGHGATEMYSMLENMKESFLGLSDKELEI